MTVNGALLVNGRISANGRPGLALGSGGGSGGSVWLTAGTLAGGGVISANGGAGNELGGGGGGGCISLQYGVNTFGGRFLPMAVAASPGAVPARFTPRPTAAPGQMLVDNGGNYGTNTPLPYLSPFDLTVRGGAVGVSVGSVSDIEQSLHQCRRLLHLHQHPDQPRCGNLTQRNY